MDITRDDVHSWLEGYDGTLKPTKKLRTYLEGVVPENRRQVDHAGTTRDVVDVILEDIGSYQ